MNVLEVYFDRSVDQCSPVRDDYKRVVKRDEDGHEFNVYEKIDYAKIQQSLGSVNDWSLNALLSAGVNPDFPIRTGLNTRLEGVGTIRDAEDFLNGMLENQDLPEDNNINNE